jgi:hypothetical protein
MQATEDPIDPLGELPETYFGCALGNFGNPFFEASCGGPKRPRFLAAPHPLAFARFLA